MELIIIMKNMNLRILVNKIGCHQLPERSFTIRGKPMTFCARCFGASVGHLFSFILFCVGLLPSFRICLFFMLVILGDWSLQKWFGIMSTNSRRFLTGVIGGIGVGTLWWTALSCLIKQFI